MKIISKTDNNVHVELGALDLMIICNAINEVCNLLDAREFQTRMGAYRKEVDTLVNEMSGLYDHIDKSEL